MAGSEFEPFHFPNEPVTHFQIDDELLKLPQMEAGSKKPKSGKKGKAKDWNIGHTNTNKVLTKKGLTHINRRGDIRRR